MWLQRLGHWGIFSLWGLIVGGGFWSDGLVSGVYDHVTTGSLARALPSPFTSTPMDLSPSGVLEFGVYDLATTGSLARVAPSLLTSPFLVAKFNNSNSNSNIAPPPYSPPSSPPPSSKSINNISLFSIMAMDMTNTVTLVFVAWSFMWPISSVAMDRVSFYPSSGSGLVSLMDFTPYNDSAWVSMSLLVYGRWLCAWQLGLNIGPSASVEFGW